MGLRMASAWKHPKTGKWWYRKATPSDLMAKRKQLAAMGITVTREVKHSLKAINNDDAEVKWSEANAECKRRFEAMRNALANGLVSLTPKQIASLAGDIARQVLASDGEASDGTMEMAGFGKLKVSWGLTAEAFKLIETHGPERYPQVNQLIEAMMQRQLLLQNIIAVDQLSRDKLKARIVKDLPNLARMLAATQEGDYRKPNWLQGRPEVSEAFPKAVTFAGLIDGWKGGDAQPKADSVRAYEGRIKSFTRWLGHDDAAKLTRADVQGWKDSMIAGEERNLKGIKLKLDAVRSMIKWGIMNGRLPYRDNPADGVSVSLKKERKKVRGYSDDEAKLILSAARQYEGFLRWGTWLMAWTGMRAGEVAQLRVADLRSDADGQWSIKITSEAGRIKTQSSERTIPLHSAVVREGFPAYVKGLDGKGKLFPELYASKTLRGLDVEAVARQVSRIARDKMRRMLKSVKGFQMSKDISLQHSWRHRMTTQMREHFQSEARLKAMLGHAGTSVTDGYGERVSLMRLREEVERIPALELKGEPIGGLAAKPKRGVAARAGASRRVAKVKLQAKSYQRVSNGSGRAKDEY